MKTTNLIMQSAVTLVATGLTLLSSETTQASGRGHSGAGLGGARGSMHQSAIRQTGFSRAISGSHERAGHNTNQSLNRGRDDRGGHGERERRHGRDDGIRHDRGDDHGRHHERGDDRGRGKDDHRSLTVTREHQPGDDRGGRGERERRHGKDDGIRHDRGDDHGRHHERGDDRGGNR